MTNWPEMCGQIRSVLRKYCLKNVVLLILKKKKDHVSWCQRSQFISNIASCELQEVFVHYSMQEETKLTSLLTTDDRLEICAIHHFLGNTTTKGTMQNRNDLIRGVLFLLDLFKSTSCNCSG